MDHVSSRAVPDRNCIALFELCLNQSASSVNLSSGCCNPFADDKKHDPTERADPHEPLMIVGIMRIYVCCRETCSKPSTVVILYC